MLNEERLMTLSLQTTPADARAQDPDLWWRHAAVYEVYLRSFADGNGDGIGDLAGVREHLDYLQQLGIDAIWFTPWYASPLVDGGYDVADYREIHPAFGVRSDAEELIREAAERGIRTIIDIVPNHISSRHPWFQEALASPPGSAARDRFWFRPGKGESGEEMPTRWPNNFGGDSWTRTVSPDGTPGEWYLHLFAPEQPDLNWSHPEVRAEFEAVLRFWFDRGVAGIRIDSAALLVKDPRLPEIPESPGPGQHPNLDRDELHDIYRCWRRIADEYSARDGQQRVLVGEVWLADMDRFAMFLRPDEMHTAFNLDFMTRPWDPSELRNSIQETLDVHARVGAPPTWLLSNHDVTRPVTRLGREDTAFAFQRKRFDTPADIGLGARRARAAAVLAATLPGVMYVYQGEELGLPEVEDIPPNRIDDPMYYRSGGTDPGRDGCRVPLPWTAEGESYGFSPEGAGSGTWLPQPSGWGDYSVEREQQDPESTLALYRRLLAARREIAGSPFDWLPSAPDVIAYRRGAATVVVNFSDQDVQLPAGKIVVASARLAGRELPPDTAVWLAPPEATAPQPDITPVPTLIITKR
jgi:alpha-glucosidase